MEQYTELEMETVVFASDDIIVTSGPDPLGPEV